MNISASKKYLVKHAVDGVYYDGNLRIDDKTAVEVDGATAKRLNDVKIVYTSVDPNGNNKPDPRPRFTFEEVSAPVESAPSGSEKAAGGKDEAPGKGSSTEGAAASGAASSAPQARRATPPPQ